MSRSIPVSGHAARSFRTTRLQPRGRLVLLASLCAGGAFALDQTTKWYMLNEFTFPWIPISPFLNIKLGFNTGVAFG